MSGDQLDLDAIEARAAAAYPGPWERDGREVGHRGQGIRWWVGICPDDETGEACRSHADAEFIAHAREDVPALVAEVRRLRADLSAARMAYGVLDDEYATVRQDRERMGAEIEKRDEDIADAVTEAYDRGYNDGWDNGAEANRPL